MNTMIYLGIYAEHFVEIVVWIIISTIYAKKKLTHYKQISLKLFKHTIKKFKQKFKKSNLPLRYKFEIWRIKCTFL